MFMDIKTEELNPDILTLSDSADEIEEVDILVDKSQNTKVEKKKKRSPTIRYLTSTKSLTTRHGPKTSLQPLYKIKKIIF